MPTSTLAETCRAFSVDYNISQISDNRDKNLNKIMQFVGVRYQMVERLLAIFNQQD